uniref:Small auxin up regulated protein n=1 Tax=Kalanchoe fedtschenkoi TaxID=63787 RepID=A0A7N0RF21_KALFE
MASNHHHNINHHMMRFHMLHHHEKKFGEDNRNVPKGCLAVMVGQGEEEQRFVIPVMYLNHPLFKGLLKEAEEEYGFRQKGPITIPCPVAEFRNIHELIDQEKSSHHHAVWCFRV